MITQEHMTLISEPHNREGNTLPAIHSTQHLIAIDKELYAWLKQAIRKDERLTVAVLKDLSNPNVTAIDFQAHLKPISWQKNQEQ